MVMMVMMMMMMMMMIETLRDLKVSHKRSSGVWQLWSCRVHNMYLYAFLWEQCLGYLKCGLGRAIEDGAVHSRIALAVALGNRPTAVSTSGRPKGHGCYTSA